MFCCGSIFKARFFYVLNNSSCFYRRLEFGICPQCGSVRFIDYKQFEGGKERIRTFSGKEARETLKKWEKKLKRTRYATFANQNVYYGDFKKTRKKDENGNAIYLQLRKNFNNQYEVLNEVKTRVYKLESPL